MLACGLENGALWILHHITLDLLNEIPYKHSAVAINKIIFSQCAKYMAYAVREFDRSFEEATMENIYFFLLSLFPNIICKSLGICTRDSSEEYNKLICANYK